MSKRLLIIVAVIAVMNAGVGCSRAGGGDQRATEVFKVGLILPLTGDYASTGRQIEGAVQLYMSQHGNKVAGKRIELVVRDDAGVPNNTTRIAGEMVTRDKIHVLAGFGLTPLALATAPTATDARVPMIVMAAATSTITDASAYIVRTSFTVPQASVGLAEWAAQNRISRVVTLVSDYAPGHDAEAAFSKHFSGLGGKVVESLRAPVASPDFAPLLQRTLNAAPDALFVFVPSGVGALVMRQFEERGLAQRGIRLIGTGDVTDDGILNAMGDVALGAVTSHHYSAHHDSKLNRAYVQAFESKVGIRPNFMSVGGYDGIHLVYAALEANGGNANGDALLAAMKGLSWESPRGPVRIDPETRDIIQNIYIREVRRAVNDQLWNVEFATIPDVKDPVKANR